MFSQIVGGITLSILAMIAIDEFISNSGKETAPIDKRNALKAEHADD